MFQSTTVRKVVLPIVWLCCFLILQLSAYPSNTSTRSESYLLGPEDQLSIHVTDLDDISDKPFRLDPDGFIDVPLVGRVHAAGMNLEQLRSELANRIKKYIDNPQITINVTDYRSQPISILGEVGTPGVHQLQGPQRLVDVLSSAGGLKQDAGPKLTITRRMQWGMLPLPGARVDASGQFSIADVPLNSVANGQSPLNNIEVRPNDVIEVPKADIVYVLGEVKKAGGFSLGTHESISLIRALSLAEGFSRDAAPKRALILRASAKGGSNETGIPVNVHEVLQGKASDPQLHADDVLFIPNNVSGSAMRRASEAALQIATGVLIYR